MQSLVQKSHLCCEKAEPAAIKACTTEGFYTHMHRAMPPNLFLYLRLSDPLDIDLLRQSCAQLSPLELALLPGVLGWLCSMALACPAPASTQKSLDVCLDKCKLALLVLT